ncbi:ubiquitin carboxyl-terminal hydrolase 10-A [Sergentomyia squamirostris]
MDQDNSATQERYEFLDLADVDDTERNQLATALYPSDSNKQTHVSWVHESQQQRSHQHQQQQNVVTEVEIVQQRIPYQPSQQPERFCRPEADHDQQAVINNCQETAYGQATATPLVRSLMPRLIPPLAAAAALPIYAIVKPTLAPLAAVPLTMPVIAGGGAAVNGTSYEKTPSESETESSVTAEYTDYINHQQQPQQQQQQQTSAEMSPHSHHGHHQSGGSGQQQQHQQHPMVSGQNPGGNSTMTTIYSSGGQPQQPAYLPQGSHMYQMMPAPMSSNVYVSNVTANVNVHSFMTPQISQSYIPGASGSQYIPGEMAPQHDPAVIHQAPPAPSGPGGRMGGGPRRGRGNKSGGMHRRGGGNDYVSRQQQQQEQHRQQQQHQGGGGAPQELMPPLMDPQQVLGTPGYSPIYYSYPNFYPHSSHNPMPHPSAQHAAGHPIYVPNPMQMYPSSHQIPYAPPHQLFMYPPAMMSPPEYPIMDEKVVEEQGQVNDGQMGVMGQMWSAQMPMEFTNMPPTQPGQEEYLVTQQEIINPSGIMMPEMMPSPQPSHQHVLNPDVANFVTMKQMAQAEQEQLMQQQPQQIVPTEYSPQKPQEEDKQQEEVHEIVAIAPVVEAPVIQEVIPQPIEEVTSVKSTSPMPAIIEVVKPVKSEDANLTKMVTEKLTVTERGQVKPTTQVWNKKNTTSVSVTALPSPAPITTSHGANDAVKPTKAPSPVPPQKVKPLQSVPKSDDQQHEAINAATTADVVCTDNKTEVSTLLNKTVQAIPSPTDQTVNKVDAKTEVIAATFQSKQVEVLPQQQPPIQRMNGATAVDPLPGGEKAPKLGTNNMATSTTSLNSTTSVTTTSTTTTAAPSKSWASLFSSDTNSAASMAQSMGVMNKKPVAKVPPFEATQTLPIDGLTYSAASAMGLPPPQVASNKSAKSASNGTKTKKSGAEERCPNLGEFLLKYHIDNSNVVLCPRGLTNRSNFCYINAILQALVACPPFYHMMKSIPLEPPGFRQKSTTPIIDAMVEFVSEFSAMPPGARVGKREKGSKGKDEIDLICDMAFEPTAIHKMLSESRSEFHVEGRQEDAEEFLGFILNGLNDEMLELTKLASKPAIVSNGEQTTNGEVSTEEGGGDDWQVIYGNRNKGTVTRTTDFGKTPISDIFGGQLRSRVQREGDHSTDVIQPFFTLQLDIEKAESVKEALEILVVKDQLEGVTCSKTNQEVVAWQQVTLEKLPVVLILHLKWFDYKMDSCTKILKTVEFPIELRIDTKILSSKKCAPKQRQYKLFAVVYHDGKEASKGHYITDVFNIGYASWIRYDDSTVKSVSEHTVLHPHLPKVPYLLYYRRCDTIGPQGGGGGGGGQSATNTK